MPCFICTLSWFMTIFKYIFQVNVFYFHEGVSAAGVMQSVVFK